MYTQNTPMKSAVMISVLRDALKFLVLACVAISINVLVQIQALCVNIYIKSIH